ncbi:Cytidylate kinase [Syntrophomonas zehnderi OL-4]|uniref:Cytidylate kinase n=1 Tax=Syntrophomonas zehnderi OL-4 TaxID=690567 RepID=A0A0E4GA42_9FIRM|nr:(d)CMP kinase [Syntrophomonas zehnderi]CFX21621.1 Cytidylate kinase [Syntrophomonas zehnderi OL-4]
MQIAIDGPAGAGKSTIARMLARELGYVYIDTGAMYRALTWKAIKNNIELNNSQALYELARETKIQFTNPSGDQRVICDGEDVTEAIRSPLINASVSLVAAKAEVRKVMVAKQQQMAKFESVVMDGRDIGEQVLPDADYKFFITASLPERARRRIAELQSQGYEVKPAEVEKEIQARDQMDCERSVGALKTLPDSIVIDTSLLNTEQLLGKMLDIIGEKKHVL